MPLFIKVAEEVEDSPDSVLSRLRLAERIASQLGIRLTRAEVWLRSLDRQLGGRRVYHTRDVRQVFGYIRGANIPFDEVIVAIDGTLKVAGEKVPMYVIVYNHRDVCPDYCDIEIDVSGEAETEVESVEDAFLVDEEFRRKAIDAFKSILEREPTVSRIVLGFSDDALYLVDDRLVYNYSGTRELMEDVVGTMIDRGPESYPELEKLSDYFEPYDTSALVEIFCKFGLHERLSECARDAGLKIIKTVRGIMLVAPDEEAPRTFVRKVIELITPITLKLPTMSELIKIVRSRLEEKE